MTAHHPPAPSAHPTEGAPDAHDHPVTTLALAAGLLAGGTLGVHAQSPGPSPDPMAPAHLTGRYIFDGDQTVSPTITSEGGVTHYRGGETWVRIAVESSDPRFAGEASFTFDRDVYPGGVGVTWGTTVITTEAGSWTGWGLGPILPSDGNAWGNLDQLTGSGAYEGLSAIILQDSSGGFEGVIVPGKLPTLE